VWLLACVFNPHFELTEPDDQALDQVVYDLIQEQKIVGLSLGLVVDGAAVYQHGYGFESIQKNIEVDPSKTLFRWASMSKMLTGTLAAMAASEGSLDLDADIRTYMPDYPYSGITLRRLLSHTAGVQHYSNGTAHPAPPISQRNNPQLNTGIEWALGYWIDAPLLFEPGEAYSYSTMGFNLAGVVLEKALKKPFMELIQERIAEPFGMQDLQPDYQWQQSLHRADGYLIPWTKADFVVADQDSDVSWKLPGGGFISTVADATAFCKGMLGVSEEVQELAWSRQKLNSGDSISYGLGWEVAGGLVYHEGYQEKAESFLRLYPQDKLCIVAFSNTRESGISEETVQLSKILNAVEAVVWGRLDAGELPIQR
jgi:CubicO group peptidase (beta-lactamase class C family)